MHVAESAIDVRIRRALPEEEARAAELIYGAPSDETAGIAGGVERAVRLGTGLFRAGLGRTPGDDVFLAFRHDRPVGVLLGRAVGSNFPVSPRAALRALPVILKLYSPWELPGLVRRAHLRARLEFPVPPGSYHVIELHVGPAHRGAGIGSALLRHSESIARERGCARINLTTALANPALRLYARLGYVEAARRIVPGYEPLTGTPGRAFLEKRLSTSGAAGASEADPPPPPWGALGGGFRRPGRGLSGGSREVDTRDARASPAARRPSLAPPMPTRDDARRGGRSHDPR